MRYYETVLRFVFLALICIKCVLSKEECIHDNKVGECKLLATCETIPLLKDVHRISRHTATLRNMTCGFEGVAPKVCCPLSRKLEECELPNGMRGECKDIRNCTAVHSLKVIQSFAFYTPGCNTSFSICCPTSLPIPSSPSTQPTTQSPLVVTAFTSTTNLPGLSTKPTAQLPQIFTASNSIIDLPAPSNLPTAQFPQIFTAPTSTTDLPKLPTASTPQIVQNDLVPISTYNSTSSIPTCEATSLPPDPSTGCCGQMVMSSRIAGGNETEINEYPWLVLLEYRDIDSGCIDAKCGGSLISGRYVLTAAQCVHEDMTTPPESVRIGEYDTRTDIDCDTRYEPPHCNSGSESIPIEKIMIHALFAPPPYAHSYDIALVRLNRTVTFNDFVKPICLPSSSTTIPNKLFVAGWGATENGCMSPVKKHVMVPYVDVYNCHFNYPRVPLKGRICAGGEIGKDACRGDAGGPLMSLADTRYELLGIVSLGNRDCSLGKPGVYTNVDENLQWIRIHMNQK